MTTDPLTKDLAHDVGYDGPAELFVGEEPVVPVVPVVPVTVALRGLFQPIDGRFHWYGRVQRDAVLDSAGPAGATVRLRTPYGEAEGRLSDCDPWGRYRLSGVGRPPFPVDAI